MRLKSVTADQTKFEYEATALDNRAAAEVKAVLVHPSEQDKYAAITKALLSAFGITQAPKDQELLHITGLGDCKPTALLRHLESLNSDAETLHQAFFVAQLLAQVRAILALQ